MISSLSCTTSNPHIAALEPVFAQATKPVQWLVIAHNDSQLIRSVCAALTSEPAAVLEVSQDTWNFASQEYADMFEWALQQGDIRNVLLVGSSRSERAASHASLVSASKHSQGTVGYDRLLANAKRNSARTAEAQDEFAGQVRQLSQVPAFRKQLSDKEIEIYGLFYRAEAGLFLNYDVGEDTFQPVGV